MRYNVCKSSNGAFLIAYVKPYRIMDAVNHSLFNSEIEVCIAALTSAYMA